VAHLNRDREVSDGDTVVVVPEAGALQVELCEGALQGRPWCLKRVQVETVGRSQGVVDGRPAQYDTIHPHPSARCLSGPVA
jgi:hypothetical protein